MKRGLLLLSVFLAAFSAGCSGREPEASPEDLALAVLAYLQMGSARVQDVLSGEDVERLRATAGERSALQLAPADLLYLRMPVHSISGAEPKVETISKDARSVRLAVVHDKSRLMMDFIRENGRWRLKLPVTVQP